MPLCFIELSVLIWDLRCLHSDGGILCPAGGQRVWRKAVDVRRWWECQGCWKTDGKWVKANKGRSSLLLIISTMEEKQKRRWECENIETCNYRDGAKTAGRGGWSHTGGLISCFLPCACEFSSSGQWGEWF